MPEDNGSQALEPQRGHAPGEPNTLQWHQWHAKQEAIHAYNHARTSVEHALKSGQHLKPIRNKLGYGDWGGWIRDEFPFSDRTARRWMELATLYEKANGLEETVTVTVLEGTVTEALKQLKKTVTGNGKPQPTTKATTSTKVVKKATSPDRPQPQPPRQVILDYTPAKHQEILDALGYLGLKWNTSSKSDVVYRALVEELVPRMREKQEQSS
jgi:hypothetical protein